MRDEPNRRLSLDVGPVETSMSEQSVSQLVETWFAGEHTMFDACTEEPEIAWRAILKILERGLADDQEAVLAAGPLETLLSWHGADFIDRVESEARGNHRFNHLLGGVWRSDMPEEVWDRVHRVRKEIW